jgi:hypothetical protein
MLCKQQWKRQLRSYLVDCCMHIDGAAVLSIHEDPL